MSSAGCQLSLQEPEANRLASGAQFAALCRLARALFAVPAASIGLKQPEACWIDLAPDADALEWSFATSLDAFNGPAAALMLVADATADPSVAAQSWVNAAPRVRFLASIAFGPGGEGRLSLFDTRPRVLDAATLDRLRDLAALAGEILRLSRELQVSEQGKADYRLLAESSNDTLVRGSLDGVRQYISPSVISLLGYEPAELIGHRAVDLVHPDDAPRFAQMMQRIHRGEFDIGTSEMRQRHKDGSWVWMEASIRLTHDRATGAPTGYVASVRGMDRRKEREAQLEHRASHDVLTGLPNRALFDQHLDEAIQRARVAGQPFALFYLDLDHFKQVNDTFGHQAGDAVLREVAARLRGAVRPQDTVARLGGDEFAMIQEVQAGADDAGSGEAGAVAQRLVAAFGAPFECAGKSLAIGISVGIALAPECGLEPQRLIAAADHGLYEAKQAGRNTFRFAPECRPKR